MIEENREINGEGDKQGRWGKGNVQEKLYIRFK